MFFLTPTYTIVSPKSSCQSLPLNHSLKSSESSKSEKIYPEDFSMSVFSANFAGIKFNSLKQ